MKELTSRERLTRLFAGREIDRTPIWLLAPYHHVDFYADIYRQPSYRRLLPYIDRYCDTFDRRTYDTGVAYNANPEIKRTRRVEKTEKGNAQIEEISYKDFTLQKSVYRGTDGTRVKYFVEDIEDLKRLIDIPYVAPAPDIEAYEREKAELGDRGLMMTDVGDPLGVFYHLMSAEDFSVYSLTEYETLLELSDVVYARTLDLYRYLLERDIGEVFFLVGAEFAGPPLVSPDKFSELCAKYVKGLVDLIRSYGKKSILHYHGQLYDVLGGMRQIAPDALHTIEAPPVGNCTIAQAREQLGDMILIGNVQYDDLAHQSREEIVAQVERAVAEGGERFILSPTAGPYEDVIPENMVDNYIAFIEAGIRYGKR